MNLISTSWSCARCGAAFISTPPEHGLCDQCLADLDALARPRTRSPTSPARCAAGRCAPTAAKPSSSSCPPRLDGLAEPAGEVSGDDG